ncbi:serine hydrolase [Mangrovicoccus sp. HB161399]|uniref:serine hydrolase domain-containing protein n=1 Tax=Mangrovicoccus sp. HB161399 TaxID=2720392 RepID=UPI0015550C42
MTAAVRIRDGRTGTLSGNPEARHSWWSVTKTVIAVLALRLAERGRLDLDAPLQGHAFTLAQLLANTSGLADYGALPEYHAAVAAGGDPWPEGELLARTGARGPLFAPGTGWAYSNVGYMLARRQVERAADRDLGQLAAEEIARPLGLGSLRLARTRQDMAGLAPGGQPSYHPGWVYHGCLSGTAADAARLMDGLFAGRLAPPDALARMMRIRPLGGAIPGRPWTAHGYGLGLMGGEMGAAGRALGHSGGGPFSTCAVYHFPDAARPATIACFASGAEDGLAERMAARFAEDG